MHPFRTGLMSLVMIFATAGLWAQTPVPPTPPTPPDIPNVPGWENYYFRFGQTQSKAANFAQEFIKAEKPEQKQEIRKKLADVVSEQFDVRMQQQRKELEDLEKQIANLRAVLKKREDAKSTIVERRIDTLIQEAEGLGWSSPGHARHEWFDMHIPQTPTAPKAAEAPRKP
jgi:hypothetical protein